VTPAVLAAVAYGGVLAWSCSLAPKVLAVSLFLGMVGAVLLAFVLVRGMEELLGSAVLLVSACYVLGLFAGRHSLDEASPLVAAGLLACTELATWSLEDRPRVSADRGLTAKRAGAVALLVFCGLVAAALVLVVAAAPVGGGLAWTLLGAFAAVGAVAVIGRLTASAR
jgi:hypothetical protein